MCPKCKTHRATAKRVRITRNGKVCGHKAFKKHLLTGKSRKRKRQLRQAQTLAPAAVTQIKKLLPYG